MDRVTALGAARRASGLYQQECADAMGISLPTYRRIETDGGDDLTLGMVRSILPHMNDISVRIMRDMVEELFFDRGGEK